MERRNFIKNISLGAAAAIISGEVVSGERNNLKNIAMDNLQTLEFPSLPYAYDGLEPYMDAKTVEIHYDRHHRNYFNNYVNAIKGTAYENMPVEKVFAEVSKAGNAVRNNGGGFYNHVLFWNNLGKGSTKPSAELSAAINKAFGSFDKMKEGLGTASKTHFGSGWGWLYLTPDKNLAIGSTPNQDNPLMDISSIKGIPLLTIDVWEHAYYLKYQNKRADFVDNIWNIINWDEVSRRYQQAMK
ncbi:MAG TPA: superoxide dismutase [Bacteroidales bacterium]|jgi:Fe-Mn family superoxide dismutase|nr:MAG: Superoxide dismutase (Mn) [Bacteroidetes bacterium ADurb.Bin145]HOU00943.1 superoxide dismutase [Bacteroidales bacterium]HQK66666.1 superoxide dismutase [Bacteroidales bacterium]